MSKKNSNPHGSGSASSGPILPNSINNLSNLPRYDVRKSEDRSAWAEEYDRIEKELLQPALPNGMVLCVRHYAELVQKYPSTPNTERRQQERTTSPSLKSSTRSKAQAKEQDGLHNHGLSSVETVTLSKSHFPNPRNILQPRPPSHSTHEAVAPRILPRLKVIPEANLGEDNVHSLKRAVAPHSHRIIPTHSSGTVEIKKNQIRTDVRSKSAGSYRLSIHRQLDNLEAGTIVNAESVAVLHTLLQPRPEFMGKFSLDLRYIDTTHILEQIKPQESVSRIAGRPCPHRTIDTFVNDASSVTSPPPQLPGVEGSDPVWINSPRSIYALLVEGLNIPSLLRTAEPLRSHQSGNSQNDTPTSGSKDGAAAHRLWQEMESERLNLLAHVQKTYHQICECVSREEVMQALRHRNDVVVLSSESSSVLRQQRQNQDNMLQAHRLRVERLEKADAEAKAALERAERRRAAMDRERHESLEDQRRRLQERLLEQQQKAEERRRMKEAAHEQHALELYERRRELDQRDRVVQETMQRAQQLRREKMCRARERKDARVQAARQRMVAHIECIAQRLEEKTLQAHERKAALDARRHEAHERRIERQRIVETIRSTALQRAQFVQQQTRQRAEERQNHAALRLRTFSQEREHEREERRIQAQAIEAARKEAQTRAACALELRRTAFTERLEQLRKRYEERVRDKEQHLQELAFQAQLSFELKNRRVQRRRRLEEFQKLRVADQLQTRTKKIEGTEQQMKKMHQQLLNMCSTSQS